MTHQPNLLTIIIPAYNPSLDLVNIIENLLTHPSSDKLENIVIVNDGSNNDDNKLIFGHFQKKPKVIVLTHNINKGKGAALKTAIKYLLADQNNSLGFLTMDADGQHLVGDVYNVVQCFLDNPSQIILGVRNFGTQVPLRSRVGNIMTRFFFKLISGISISDTQTGLRAFPKEKSKEFLLIKQDGYEFEMDMILKLKSLNLEVKELPISTIYIENNKSSHFNPVVDSLKIYFVLFRYLFGGLLSALIDYLIFAIVYFASNNISNSQFIARSLSCIFNFIFNKKIVFVSQDKILLQATKYLALTLFSGFGSYYLMILILTSILENVFLAKLFSEIIFFFINFYVQKKIIFKNK